MSPVMRAAPRLWAKVAPSKSCVSIIVLPFHADEEAGGWHTVSDGRAAAATSTEVPEPISTSAAPGGSHALAGTDAGQADTGAGAASSPAAAGGQSSGQATAVSAAAADAAEPEAGAASAMPAYAHMAAHLVPDVEEDDYDAD